MYLLIRNTKSGICEEAHLFTDPNSAINYAKNNYAKNSDEKEAIELALNKFNSIYENENYILQVMCI